MLNKKGFTMIELLEVITLLGIILIVAVPAVSKYVTKSRSQSFDTMSKSLYEAGASKFMDDGRVIDPCVVDGVNTEEEFIRLLKQPGTDSETGEIDKTHSVLSSQCKENVNIVSYESEKLVSKGYLEPLVSPSRDGNICDGYVDILKVKFGDSSDLDMDDYYYRVYITCPGNKEFTTVYTSTNTKGIKDE